MTVDLETPKAESSEIHKARALLEAGEFEEGLFIAQNFVLQPSCDPRWYRLQAQALTALGRPQQALHVLREALNRHQNDIGMLRLARSIAFQHGFWEAALAYGEQLLFTSPDDAKVRSFNLLTLLAMGRGEVVRSYAPTIEESDRQSRKAIDFESEIRGLSQSAPLLTRSWEVALGIGTAPALKISEKRSDPVTLIQYWSQGELTGDLAIVFAQWERLAKQLGLGPVILFNKETAGRWIAECAPEFSQAFASAFHYAMESDIFRVAYASKKPCLYVDIDGWPLPRAADILKTAMYHGGTMLYFRAYRPWILNGLFLSYPTCSFIKLLADQTSRLKIAEMPQTHGTIDATFGPSRYNQVLRSLTQASTSTGIFQPEGQSGLSLLRFGQSTLCFTHEAAVASVKPPFALAYKTTEANWKRHGARA